MDIVIRAAGADEVDRLEEVERDGDRRYRGYDGVPAGFDDTVALSTLREAAHGGRVWVAAGAVGPGAGDRSDDGALIGFALGEMIDDHAHLGQVSVRLGWQGRGVGRRLITAVTGWATARGLGALTLCTFADVEWNRPLYEHLGFVVVPEERWTPGLRAVFEADGALGLDLRRRVVMRLDLPPG